MLLKSVRPNNNTRVKCPAGRGSEREHGQPRTRRRRYSTRGQQPLVLVLDKAAGGLEVCADHLADERFEVNFALPAEHALSFGGVSEQEPKCVSEPDIHLICSQKENILDFCGTEVFRVHFDDDLAGLDVDAHLVFAASFPSAEINEIECLIVYMRGWRSHLNVMPTALKDFTTNSRTRCVSPVASTKSSA